MVGGWSWMNAALVNSFSASIGFWWFWRTFKQFAKIFKVVSSDKFLAGIILLLTHSIHQKARKKYSFIWMVIGHRVTLHIIKT